MPKIKVKWSELQKAVIAANEAECRAVSFEARTDFTQIEDSVTVNVEIEIDCEVNGKAGTVFRNIK